MLEVVQALEGPIAPMECFHETPEGKVLCSHETDDDHACATKLLWTRVQGGVTKALAGTTLADLVEFADRRRPARAKAAERRLAGGPQRKPETMETRWLSLKSATCTSRAEDKEILKGVDLDVAKGKIHALMGPNGSGKSTLANAIMGHPGSRSPRARSPSRARTSPRPTPTSARAPACSWPSSTRSRSPASP